MGAIEIAQMRRDMDAVLVHTPEPTERNSARRGVRYDLSPNHIDHVTSVLPGGGDDLHVRLDCGEADLLFMSCAPEKWRELMRRGVFCSSAKSTVGADGRVTD
jgi:hypothetical protein